jgi:hypothetical protein
MRLIGGRGRINRNPVKIQFLQKSPGIKIGPQDNEIMHKIPLMGY